MVATAIDQPIQQTESTMHSFLNAVADKMSTEANQLSSAISPQTDLQAAGQVLQDQKLLPAVTLNDANQAMQQQPETLLSQNQSKLSTVPESITSTNPNAALGEAGAAATGIHNLADAVTAMLPPGQIQNFPQEVNSIRSDLTQQVNGHPNYQGADNAFRTLWTAATNQATVPPEVWQTLQTKFADQLSWKTTNPDGTTTSYNYNLEANKPLLTALDNGNKQTTFNYNPDGSLSSVTYPQGTARTSAQFSGLDSPLGNGNTPTDVKFGDGIEWKLNQSTNRYDEYYNNSKTGYTASSIAVSSDANSPQTVGQVQVKVDGFPPTTGGTPATQTPFTLLYGTDGNLYGTPDHLNFPNTNVPGVTAPRDYIRWLSQQ